MVAFNPSKTHLNSRTLLPQAGHDRACSSEFKRRPHLGPDVLLLVGEVVGCSGCAGLGRLDCECVCLAGVLLELAC